MLPSIPLTCARRSAAPARAVWASLGFTVLLAACGGDDDAPPPQVAEVASGPPASALPEITASAPRGFPLDAVEVSHGRMRIGISGDGLTLFAKGVPRFEVLEAIAERYNFTIIDWDQRDPVIDAELSAVTLEDALAQMIEPTPYALRYVQDPEIGRALVTELEIGEEDEARRLVKLERAGLQEEPQTKEDEQAARRREVRLRRAYVPPSTEEDRSFRMARREERQARWREENLAMLEAVDPNARAEAVFNLDATNLQEHDQLEDLLLNDPDPRVRAEAAAMFSFGEAEGAVPSLLRALQDPAPEVVVAAAEALSWTSDPKLASEIEPLLNHPSENVREQAAETLDFLR